MSYFFNKTSLAIVIAMVFIIAISANEIAKYVNSVNQNHAQWFVWQQLVQRNSYSTQEACQRATGYICDSNECDASTPGCVNGWHKTNIDIPLLYRNASTIALAVQLPQQPYLLTIDPDRDTISMHNLTATSTNSDQKKMIEPSEVTRLINKMILNDLPSLMLVTPTTTDEQTHLRLTVSSPTDNESAATSTTSLQTLSCLLSRCPDNFKEVAELIVRLWDTSLATIF